MTTICVPELEERPWPTLGPVVCEWLEENLVFGPGDLRGQPLRLSMEQKAFLYRVYELHPLCACWGKRTCLHQARPARRRFNRVALSLAKGLSKTELGSAITAAELHPDAPVRAVSWYKLRGGEWVPEGSGVNSPYIPVLATTEEQVEDLGFGVLLDMLSNSRLSRDFDLGLERIVRWGGDGICQPMSTAPNSKDGALTTFQWFDETHRLYLANQKHAHQTMLANLAKRPLADPWSMETTTAYAPGQNSIAEDTMEYGRRIADGRAKDPRLFFFHREASPKWDISKVEDRRQAVIEARGPEAAEWSDIDRICAQWDDPSTDKQYLERVWLNRATGMTGRAFDAARWAELAGRLVREIPARRLVTLGFDGARFLDATALVATDVETGFQQVVGLWENPGRGAWETPLAEVESALEYAFERWEVWRGYFDPYYWESELARWAGKWGEKRIVTFATNRWKLMALALRSYHQAIAAGLVTNDGHEGMYRHMGNAVRQYVHFDVEGEQLWLVQKERADSPFKIDAVVAGCLSWQARLDALTEGAKATPDVEYHVYTL